MGESQNIEYKESWRDEYLKWLCGFANAQGGTIYIGMDDAGNVVGVKNAKKLMEDNPELSEEIEAQIMAKLTGKELDKIESIEETDN